ncbi:hypothetical protein B0675_02125 [Streptomyces sp. M41(2017)]|uniref:hypothetical protein n=1 Tax=Streptomyces sp. M41(2017) TaxID=1955065 RepID=UPI0009BF0DF7|nr:hypothetical protein [Streptomyces sp. M41(2017)]OQQ16104.1 hypothetical protein B0675_02125 [Streptomyces sp. M41(2017)]
MSNRDWGDLEDFARHERALSRDIVSALSRKAAASAGQWPPTDEIQPEEKHVPDRAESPTEQTGLRQRVADAIHHDLNARRVRRDQGLLGIVPRLTDAVMAVLASAPATEATEPASPSAAMTGAGVVVRSELAAGVQRCDEAADVVRDARTLREQIAGAIYEKCNPGHHWASAHPDDVLAYGSDADAALTVGLPHGKFMGDQLRHSEAVIERVIQLNEQWVKAGPPPLGASMARWWDARLVELHNAIVPPGDQSQEK